MNRYQGCEGDDYVDKSKYLSIYSLENAAKKIADNLDLMLEQRPKMYEKTKVRYNNIALSLISSVEKIAKIAQLDMLSTQSSDEFSELSPIGFDENIDLALKQAQQEVETARAFSSNTSNKISIDLNAIDKIFYEVSQIEFGWSEVNQCARLLYSWYHSRFIEHPAQTCNYSYLGGWVTKFILQFGNHCAKHSADGFETSLYEWCKRLDISSVIYAQPFFIYNILNSSEPAEFTLEAVLVNDLLYSKGLYQLSELYSMFDSQEVYRIVKNKNPALTPKINLRFAKQSDLIESVGFTKTLEGGLS